MLLHKLDFFTKVKESQSYLDDDFDNSRSGRSDLCDYQCQELSSVYTSYFCCKYSKDLGETVKGEPVKCKSCLAETSVNYEAPRCSLDCRSLISDDSGCHCESYDSPLETDTSCLPLKCVECVEDEEDYTTFKDQVDRNSSRRIKNPSLCDSCAWIEGTELCPKCGLYNKDLKRYWSSEDEAWFSIKCDKCLCSEEPKGLDTLEPCDEDCTHQKREGACIKCTLYGCSLGLTSSLGGKKRSGIKCRECQELSNDFK